MNNTKQEITLSEILDQAKTVFLLLLSRWKLLVATGLIGGTLGFVFASFQPRSYKARLSFMLNENEPAIPTSLSSLAGLTGLGSGTGSDDKLLFMATSRYIVANTLLTPASVLGKEKLLANHFIDIYAMSDQFESDTSLRGFTYIKNTHLSSLTYQENKVIDRIIGMIIEGKQLAITSKKKNGLVAQSAGIIIMEYTSISEELAYRFINALYERLGTYYIDKAVHRQLRNYTLIKTRADSLKVVLLSKEGEGASFVDRNLNPARMTVRMNTERMRRDLEVLNLMYAEVLKNLEVAKFTLESQTPALTPIDFPTIPLEMKKLSRLKSAIAGGIISGLLVVTYVILSSRLKKITR